jgi:hypothetical protein
MKTAERPLSSSSRGTETRPFFISDIELKKGTKYRIVGKEEEVLAFSVPDVTGGGFRR